MNLVKENVKTNNLEFNTKIKKAQKMSLDK